MATAERAQEAAMWVAVLATAVLAAARFATYINTIRLLDVRPEAAFAWWATYALALALVVVGLLGQRSTRHRRDGPAWFALLVGILIFVIMPANPAGTGALGAGVLAALPLRAA
jgi:hypothetical protein